MTRYIEADELLARLKSDALWKLIARYNIEGVIEALPTADVVPVRHGEWLYRKFEVFGHEYAGNCYCSACGMDAPTDDGAEYMTRYCPNCGAYMFGKGEEE